LLIVFWVGLHAAIRSFSSLRFSWFLSIAARVDRSKSGRLADTTVYGFISCALDSPPPPARAPSTTCKPLSLRVSTRICQGADMCQKRPIKEEKRPVKGQIILLTLSKGVYTCQKRPIKEQKSDCRWGMHTQPRSQDPVGLITTYCACPPCVRWRTATRRVVVRLVFLAHSIKGV
jgi:hypothetical protein